MRNTGSSKSEVIGSCGREEKPQMTTQNRHTGPKEKTHPKNKLYKYIHIGNLTSFAFSFIEFFIFCYIHLILFCFTLCRIYGDKATDIVDGLKKNPVVAVPLVLRR